MSIFSPYIRGRTIFGLYGITPAKYYWAVLGKQLWLVYESKVGKTHYKCG